MLTVPVYFLWPIATIGAIWSAKTNRRRVAQLCGVQAAAAALIILGTFGVIHWTDHHRYDGSVSPILILIFAGVAVGGLIFYSAAIGIIVEGRRARAASSLAAELAGPAPIGHTIDGQPIYPVVGYTPDGEPVTADRAVGVHPTAVGTNTMAIVSLIAAWNFFPLGIIFGHIALSQINRTGQGGRGLAIAGLVLGYLTLAATVIVVIALVSATSHF
ncbi:DUF4190 domain-containing protein [Mycobacterium sp. OTB74]|jgi:hypothetical protein|uniref:DUF4190 domain-containing protein n=1 Tax=Mycobacterium sp. OTB74 TaxID=1853452 RepID=UPI00247440E7|nr:DUF4190 domain-containing protein [Mycobacterium sp. OTB74]MDH6247896.1 hypothetical protein [Mycobacterium sp. OTB74]